MTDYGYIFSTALQKRLKEKIHAGVFVKSTDDDRLEVKIIRKSENLIFETYIDKFCEKILYGYSTEYAAYEVFEKYKRFIMKRYFV